MVHVFPLLRSQMSNAQFRTFVIKIHFSFKFSELERKRGIYNIDTISLNDIISGVDKRRVPPVMQYLSFVNEHSSIRRFFSIQHKKRKYTLDRAMSASGGTQSDIFKRYSRLHLGDTDTGPRRRAPGFKTRPYSLKLAKGDELRLGLQTKTHQYK